MPDKYGKYVGPLAHLKGKMALVRVATHGKVVAQFDDRMLRQSGEPWPTKTQYLGTIRFPWVTPDFSKIPDDALGYRWHVFNPEDFEYDERTEK
jgi:hypothetical protein